ncbi:hypothetical protein N0B40_03535 [Chryseobacterium oranimense]|uniref:hypothetical protein n=1 Tax=Chryseobacterium oranimense TaxID=421058 RepID=UPI0021B003BF|nr:hypothetical protein [Chryseobacterium oranimense]UWX61355.1 hypothetical protein N0B40_03535 [Chryseobacterium oranimense]
MQSFWAAYFILNIFKEDNYMTIQRLSFFLLILLSGVYSFKFVLNGGWMITPKKVSNTDGTDDNNLTLKL